VFHSGARVMRMYEMGVIKAPKPHETLISGCSLRLSNIPRENVFPFVFTLHTEPRIPHTKPRG
jgi:hypothetical protein